MTKLIKMFWIKRNLKQINVMNPGVNHAEVKTTPSKCFNFLRKRKSMLTKYFYLLEFSTLLLKVQTKMYNWLLWLKTGYRIFILPNSKFVSISVFLLSILCHFINENIHNRFKKALIFFLYIKWHIHLIFVTVLRLSATPLVLWVTDCWKFTVYNS